MTDNTMGKQPHCLSACQCGASARSARSLRTVKPHSCRRVSGTTGIVLGFRASWSSARATISEVRQSLYNYNFGKVGRIG